MKNIILSSNIDGTPPEKPVQWRGSSHRDILGFPADARRKTGYQIGRVQHGDEADDWRPMPSIGDGAIEIRIHTRAEHRVITESMNLASRTKQVVLRARTGDGRRRRAGQQLNSEARTEAGKAGGRGTNIFEELGFAADEAENLKTRATLMNALRRRIAGMTQTAAAAALGVSQPRVSDLVRGEIDRFTVDALINMLAHAGVRVTVVTEG